MALTHDPPTTGVVPWRRLIVPVYGPTMLISIGQGAVLPIVALSARSLGATVGVAALLVALIGIGQLLGDLPAGSVAARIGEKRGLILACALDCCALLGAFLASSLVLLAVAMFVTGLAYAMFSLARQSYLTEAIPLPMRARAMSTLGGTFRVGLFIGPFMTAAILSFASISAVYAFGAFMSLATAILTAFLPDVTLEHRRAHAAAGEPHRSVASVLYDHRRVLLTLGTGILIISAARTTRSALVPLWADSQGIDAATTSVIFGISAGLDLLLFYPGGAIMDRFGRVYVAAPSLIILGTGFLLLPLTSTPAAIAAVAALMGLGNGLSAGIVMTLGADASPRLGRAQFLGGWRLCSDLGNAGGPLVISAISAVATLAAAAYTMGIIALAGSGWLIKWVPLLAARPQRRPRPRHSAPDVSRP
jgi:MFS family permease